MRVSKTQIRFAALWAITAFAADLRPQTPPSIEGTVRLGTSGEPLHGASVLIEGLGRTATSDGDGRYVFHDVPPGTYGVIAHLDSIFTEESKIVTVVEGRTARVDFALDLRSIKVEITVTAKGRQQSAFDSFQSVDSLDAYELNESIGASIGEVLGDNPGTGVAKRSFGPGSSRPIIRGFDGDRVLILEDGIRSGTLSSQSGDHGELINAAALDRLEVVKGPATLLYGSNALGGVVNAISRHHAAHEHPHQGLCGFVSSSAGSTNSLAGSTAGFEYGRGNWLLWGGGGGQRTGDYDTPTGTVDNSRTRTSDGRVGIGWYGEKTFFSLGVKADDGVNGVPFASAFEPGLEGEQGEHDAAEEGNPSRVQLEAERFVSRFTWGRRRIGPAIEAFRLSLSLTDWAHDEVEVAGAERTVGTQFTQQQFVYRGVFEQAKRGPLTGRFGFWGLARDYDVVGAEALSPPVDQRAVAVFGLEEIELENVKFQFGGRLERNRYEPVGLRERTFSGVSAAAGIHVDLGRGSALVLNYAHSHRAPALEELYNNGPHIGTISFEVGDPNLTSEVGNGFEVSLRREGGRVRGELNGFYYGFDNFVFPFATGEVREGLPVLQFTQLDSRFLGMEVGGGLRLRDGLWFNLGMDLVDAQETSRNTPLPRIPPLRAKVGFDWRRGGISIKPQIVMAASQHQTFTTETRTQGYTVLNLKASYTIPSRHLAHQFSVNVFNIADRLYRNHSSFIKDLAPEIGRGVRFTYVVRFF